MTHLRGSTPSCITPCHEHGRERVQLVDAVSALPPSSHETPKARARPFRRSRGHWRANSSSVLRSRFNRAAAEVAQVLNNFAPPRLAVQFYLPRLLKFGDALLQANAYYIAQKQCYERFIEVRPAPTNLHAACARVWLLRAERPPLPKSWLRSGRPGHSQLPHLPAPARVCAGTSAKDLVPTYSTCAAWPAACPKLPPFIRRRTALAAWAAVCVARSNAECA